MQHGNMTKCDVGSTKRDEFPLNKGGKEGEAFLGVVRAGSVNPNRQPPGASRRPPLLRGISHFVIRTLSLLRVLTRSHPKRWLHP